jgi:hypothetical protein
MLVSIASARSTKSYGSRIPIQFVPCIHIYRKPMLVPMTPSCAYVATYACPVSGCFCACAHAYAHVPCTMPLPMPMISRLASRNHPC